MLLSKLKVIRSHGKAYIPALDQVKLAAPYRGRVELSGTPTLEQLAQVRTICPSGAIDAPFAIDLGRCIFCGECAQLLPEHIRFTPDYRMAVTRREDLVITPDQHRPIHFEAEVVRREIRRIYGRALRLRQVSAGGDGACETELNASMNVNFDFSRYGIEFVASPRHADGVVITGPITENMAIPLEICYRAIGKPSVVILVGSEAISGGLYADSKALNRSFLERHGVDLYIPGNPTHPMAFIEGVMMLLGHFKRE